eukprot:1909345-Pyramimonas_sp.AAC.1
MTGVSSEPPPVDKHLEALHQGCQSSPQGSPQSHPWKSSSTVSETGASSGATPSNTRRRGRGWRPTRCDIVAPRLPAEQVERK